MGNGEAKTRWRAMACMLVLAAPRAATAIVGGTAETGSSGVVAVSITYEGVDGLCTGVLIAPRVVLTAAFCLDPDTTAAVPTAVSVFMGNDVSGAGTWTAASEWITHPTFDGHAEEGNLALILLEERAVPAPVPLRATALGAAQVGSDVRVVGFGATSALGSGTEGVKRAIADSVRELDSTLLFVGESGRTACFGDSGAPVLMMDGGAEQVVGLVSYSDMNCSERTAATRVAPYAAWIDAWIAAHDEAPVATGQSLSTERNAAAAVTLAGTDAEGATLAFEIVTSPAHGALSGTAPDLTYTPDADFSGTDSFTFRVNDGRTDSDPATVTITVTAPEPEGGDGGCGAAAPRSLAGLAILLLLAWRRRRA